MRVYAALVALVVAGCASNDVATRHSGNVAIDTVSNGQVLAGAQCVVTNLSGRWELSTPGVVALGAPSGDLRVVCSKPGYRTSEFVYRPAPYSAPGNPNVGIGVGGGSGNVGVGLGFNFPVGGSRHRAAYPERIAVQMHPQ